MLAYRRIVEGASYVEIAEELDCSLRFLYRQFGTQRDREPTGQRSPLRLSPAEREEISRGLQAGLSCRAIAGRMGRAASTVARDVAANGGRDAYRAWLADERAVRLKRRSRPPKLARQVALRDAVERHLTDLWSPQQISAHLRASHPNDAAMRVSHETIYQALYSAGGDRSLRRELTACLRSGRTRRKPRRRSKTQGRIIGMVLVHERPREAEDRAVPGHWEGDLVIGSDARSAIGTLVERATRFVLLLHLPTGMGAADVRTALLGRMEDVPAVLRRSLTWDQGKEMHEHRRITLDAGLPVYFCNPRSPWQRGTNENTNGLLRQYFPRGTSFHGVSRDRLAAVEAQLNQRPRQVLGWRSPAEAYAEAVAMID